MKQFKGERTGNLIHVRCKPYKLIIIDAEPIDWRAVTFDILDSNQNLEMMVSGRDITDYEDSIRRLEIDPLKIYVEVGAGLGEFIHKAVEANPEYKPIIIDPINYALLHEMLEAAKMFQLKEETCHRVSLYQDRCEAVLNPDKIRLIHCKIEDALTLYPDLEEIADVLVDHYAAAYYGKDKQKIIDIERRLLKEGGEMYHSYYS